MKKILFAAVILAAGMLASCNKDGGNKDPYEGKTNPSTICTEHLIAYFPLDGNGTEMINNIQPVMTGKEIAYAKGRRGLGLEGGEEHHLAYELSKIKGANEIKELSLAMWLKTGAVAQNPVGENEPMYFNIINDTEFWGGFAMAHARGGVKGTDSTNVKFSVADYYWDAPAIGSVIKADRFNHLVFTFHVLGADSVALNLYVNGVEDPDYSQVLANGKEVDFSNQTHLVLAQWGRKVIQGATDDWMGNFDGIMDEVRFYDAALSAEEAKALYDAEITVID